MKYQHPPWNLPYQSFWMVAGLCTLVHNMWFISIQFVFCTSFNVRLWLYSAWNPSYSGMLRSVDWSFTDVSGQIVCPIFSPRWLLDPWKWDILEDRGYHLHHAQSVQSRRHGNLRLKNVGICVAFEIVWCDWCKVSVSYAVYKRYVWRVWGRGEVHTGL